jgi:hypothetical protein
MAGLFTEIASAALVVVRGWLRSGRLSVWAYHRSRVIVRADERTLAREWTRRAYEVATGR